MLEDEASHCRVSVVDYSRAAERPARAAHGRDTWHPVHWPNYARAIRARGYCRTFTDFLLQIGVNEHTSRLWRKHPEWKAVGENFPQRTRTYETRCIYGATIARFNELLHEALADGVPEREAHWQAADQAISERTAANKERSTARRIARNGGTDPVRPGKGRLNVGQNRKRAQQKGRLLFRQMAQWNAMLCLSHMHKLTIKEVIEKFYHTHAQEFTVAAQGEYEREIERFGSADQMRWYWEGWV